MFLFLEGGIEEIEASEFFRAGKYVAPPILDGGDENDDDDDDADDDDDDDAAADGDLGISSNSIEEIELSILGQEIIVNPHYVPNRLREFVNQNLEDGVVLENRLRNNV